MTKIKEIPIYKEPLIETLYNDDIRRLRFKYNLNTINQLLDPILMENISNDPEFGKYKIILDLCKFKYFGVNVDTIEALESIPVRKNIEIKDEIEKEGVHDVFYNLGFTQDFLVRFVSLIDDHMIEIKYFKIIDIFRLLQDQIPYKSFLDEFIKVHIANYDDLKRKNEIANNYKLLAGIEFKPVENPSLDSLQILAENKLRINELKVQIQALIDENNKLADKLIELDGEVDELSSVNNDGIKKLTN